MLEYLLIKLEYLKLPISPVTFTNTFKYQATMHLKLLLLMKTMGITVESKKSDFP